MHGWVLSGGEPEKQKEIARINEKNGGTQMNLEKIAQYRLIRQETLADIHT